MTASGARSIASTALLALATARCGGGDAVAPPPGPDVGTIRVAVTEAGVRPDADGYTVAVDAGAARTATAGTPLTITDVAAGARRVALRGLASQCVHLTDSVLTVAVVRGDTTPAEFRVDCVVPLETVVLHESDRQGGDLEIWTTDTLFSSLRRLTKSPGVDREPMSSPDGRRIAFTSLRTGTSQVFVMNANGTEPLQVSEGYGAHPHWSPDGSRIAYECASTGDARICTVASDGTGRATWPIPGAVATPEWSPDGASVVYRGVVAGIAGIHRAAADGTGVARLLTGETFALPSWSPDGTRIAFQSSDEGSPWVYTALANGTDRVRVSWDMRGFAPSWTPDGRVVFHSDPLGNLDLFVVGARGVGRTQLTFAVSNESNGRWARR